LQFSVAILRKRRRAIVDPHGPQHDVDRLKVGEVELVDQLLLIALPKHHRRNRNRKIE
jgi:hypothetical protein